MLKQRIATATVLLLLFLTIIFYFPTGWFAAILGVLVLIGADEWWRLVGAGGTWKRILWFSLISSSLALLWFYRDWLSITVIFTGAAWWLSVLVRLWIWPDHAETAGAKLLGGGMVLLPSWSALIYLHEDNIYLLVSLFLIVWLSDTGAFFTGRKWGKTKLAPIISPGKTMEGVVGGIVLSVLFLTVLLISLGLEMSCGLLFIGMAILVSMFSVVGDLWESKMKRAANVKDSGKLFPGHGGVLDRIDSVTAAAPMFVMGLYGIGRYAPGCVDLAS